MSPRFPTDWVDGVVDQDKQLERGIISLGQDQLVHLEKVFALSYLHGVWPENRNFAVITECLVRDNHVNLNRAWSGPEFRSRN
jgi:hypothetical protein